MHLYFLSSLQCIIVISSHFIFLHRGGMSQSNPWNFWSSRFRNFENCESLNFNLGQNKMEQKTPIPQIKDEAAQNPKGAIFPSLIWESGGVRISHLFCLRLYERCQRHEIVVTLNHHLSTHLSLENTGLWPSHTRCVTSWTWHYSQII